MTFTHHLRRFLADHIFSWRILHCNLFNMVFWIFVVTGGSFGFTRGVIPCLVGLFLGAFAGTCFLALGYVAYHRRHASEPEQNQETR